MYPMYMIFGSTGQGMVLPQEDRVPSGHVTLLKMKTIVFNLRMRLIVLRLWQKLELQLYVDTLPWRTRSPDLSQIENVWDVIQRQLKHHSQQARERPSIYTREASMKLHTTN
ncbi:hypothetical protein TNCV_2945831 [Trichonephila clavipes]|nr:hypothetical protein TNCV_2945831 [Trichonephila clavipes]